MADFFKIGQAAYGGGADVSKAIGEGLKELRQSFTGYLYEWQKKERAWKESIAPKLAKIGEDYNPTLVDESQRSSMTAALQQSRLKYADILKQVRNMDPTSEEYINLMGQATDIVAGFNTTFENGKEFSKLGNEYALAAQKPDGLNRGMTVEKRAALGKIFVDKDYTIERNPITGEMSYIINSDAVGKDGTTVGVKGLKISQDELDDFKLPNQDSVNKYLAQNKAFSDAGKKGEKLTTESADYKTAAFQLQTELNNLDIEDLRSLALDSFIEGMPIAILDADSRKNIYDLTKEELAAKLQDGMLANLLATNQRDYKAPAPKEKETSSYDQALSLYRQLKQNPIGYFEAYTGVAPVWDRKTNIVEIYEGGELQFKYDLNNPAQRGGFYKQLLDASDYLKGTSAKEEETRRIFDMLVMSGARGSSPTTPSPNTKLDNGKKPTAPPTIEERADQAFNTEGFSTESISEEDLSGELNRSAKFFIDKLSKTKANITEQDIAEAVYNSPGKQIITIFGKEYKPKALYKKDIKLQSKDQEDFENYLNASIDPDDVPRQTKLKYKGNVLGIDISELTPRDIEKIKLKEKGFTEKEIDIAEKQEKFKSKKIT